MASENIQWVIKSYTCAVANGTSFELLRKILKRPTTSRRYSWYAFSTYMFYICSTDLETVWLYHKHPPSIEHNLHQTFCPQPLCSSFRYATSRQILHQRRIHMYGNLRPSWDKHHLALHPPVYPSASFLEPCVPHVPWSTGKRTYGRLLYGSGGACCRASRFGPR